MKKKLLLYSRNRDETVLKMPKKDKRAAPEIQTSLNITREDPLCLGTVKRRLAAAGLHGRVEKPLLKPQCKKKRLQWAKGA